MTAPLTQTVGQGAAPTLTGLKVLTGATAIFCAAHRGKDGALHGHTWEVTAWWSGEPCAVEKKQMLDNYLSSFDHTILGNGVGWSEALAKSVLTGLDCERVEVSRPSERLHAIVERIAA